MEKEKKKQGKKEPNGRLYSILAIVLAAAFVVCAILAVRNYLQQKKAEEQFAALSDLQENTTNTKETEQSTEAAILSQLGITVPQKNLDWDALRAENEDIYAWIYIPGTQVDYPILQHSTENDYYLDKNLDGSSGYPGCIYTQLYNGKEFTDPNTVLYGHNMGNGTMFGSLHEYEDNTFFEEHRYVYVYTPEKTFVYDIFAACTFSDVHLIQEYQFMDAAGYNRYVEDITSVRDMKSHVREGVAASYGDCLLTMSTCVKNHPTERYIVTAVLIN